MAISLNEQIQLTCMSCGKRFETEVWSLVDATERPDLAQALLDGNLDLAICPHCNTSNQSQVGLLFHDPEHRRVYFAVPANAPEHRWREQAQQLLYALASALPEEAQLPYLGDVQVDQEIAGMRRSMLRHQRRRTPGAQPSFGKPIVLPGAAEPPSPRQAPSQKPQTAGPHLTGLIEQVVAVSSLDELRALVLHHPQLLGDEADVYLRDLADVAFNQGDRETSTALSAARNALLDIRAGREVGAGQAPAAVVEEGVVVATERPAYALAEPAYQALLHTASDSALMEAIRLFPTLLEPWADDVLVERMEAALDEGNERLATLIEERRDALGALRLMLTDAEPLSHAIEALLQARDTDAIERVLVEHPALLTETAQLALAAYVERVRAAGQDRAAERAEARAGMLQQVRAGISVE